MFLSLCSWIEGIIEISIGKKLKVVWFHLHTELLIYFWINFMFKQIFLKYFFKTNKQKRTKTKTTHLANSNRKQLAARCTGYFAGSQALDFHSSQTQEHCFRTHVQQDDLISPALTRARAWFQQREPAHAVSGLRGYRNHLASCSDWQWNCRCAELGNLSLAPAGKGEAPWTVYEDLDRSV